jgi:hypothetical protein
MRLRANIRRSPGQVVDTDTATVVRVVVLEEEIAREEQAEAQDRPLQR